MKPFVLVFLCSLACVGCAKQLTTLSDGQPGYAVHCETVQTRCFDEIALLCRDKNYTIVSERAQIWRPPLDWVDSGGPHIGFNSQFWMEVRCDP